ncbi:OmpH family outer membrane protein [Caldichromatium japonicum]|uniref:OmpH family outer membrane protein n=1 Tax=Caldichromatium japonicum TaxID=2699430 RepID=A0A6G7VDN7_9GAMM|nr:OmpH family outer membrane protein [Caldichromatium japonicum]QIK38159.1 OmpH family outer membrane protein [Caldichromatium japonicum]
MSRVFPSLALTLVILGCSIQVLAADAIGIVDMQKVLEESKLGQRLQKQLRDEFEPRTKDFAAEEREIAQMQQALNKDRPLMSKEQIAKREQEIKDRIEAYQKKIMPIQQELMKAQQEKGREILEPARDVLKTVAKNKKLGMVLERSTAGLLYVDDTVDITAEVIKQLDAKTK